MKKYIILVLGLLGAISAFAQSADEKVGALMNQGKWFELREFYETNADSVHPFLDLFGKAMLANFFNRPEEAATLCDRLLNSGQLDLGNVVSVGSILCSNLSKLGLNEKAVQILESINASIAPYHQHLDSATIAGIKTNIALYKALSQYKINDLKPFQGKAIIPFYFKPIGSEKSQSVSMNINGAMNGHECSMIFDTGAGVNVISDSLAMAMGVDILDVNLVAGGIGAQSAKLAVVKELKIGDITICNVPFYVMTIKSGNDEADRYMRDLHAIIGRNVMETVKYLTIDFSNQTIAVLQKSDIPENVATNMSISNGGIYKLHCGTFDGERLILNPDTGDSSFGMLYSNTLSMFQKHMSLNLAPDSVRMAGSGGVIESRYYDVKDMPLVIGDATVVIPQLPLLKSDTTLGNDAEFSGRMGIETFRLFKTVSFDLSRMIMYPEVYKSLVVKTEPSHEVPQFRYQDKSEMKPWQTAAFIGLALGKELLLPASSDYNLDK
ncbi:MAG: retropepsin-like domain-containing protein [Paramuribaculum sp.]|nr:retropepsin-like domain-containing protein [Paramuribaculum sp.]